MSLHLLVVDDDPAGLLALSSALQRYLAADVVVDTAPTAQSALRLLSVKPYDVVVTDIRLGDMDGVALLREVKRKLPMLPVLVFTAEGRDREDEARAQGAYAFLDKPIDLDHLFSVIESALERTDLDRRVQCANTTSALNSRLRSSRDPEPASPGRPSIPTGTSGSS